MPKKRPRKLTAAQGLWIGLLLLGQVTAILILTAVGGYLVDLSFGTAPFGLAGSVVLGGMGATVLVLKEVARLTEGG